LISFKKTIGNEKAKEYLKKLLISKKIPSSLLFIGPEGVGKATCAFEFIKIYFCLNDDKPCDECINCKRINHLNFPGLKLVLPLQIEENIVEEINSGSINPENLRGVSFSRDYSISINQIREIKEKIIYPPHEGDRIFYLFLDADLMGREAQNAFLKTLEEPPPYITFILISSHPELLLPTIRSRTQKINFTPLTFEEFSKYKFSRIYNLDYLYNLSGGSIGKAKKLISQNIEEIKQKMLQILMRKKSPYQFLKGEIKRDDLILMCNVLQFILKDFLNIKSGREDGVVFKEMIPFYIRYKEKISYEEIEKRYYESLELENAIINRVNISLILLSFSKFSFV
jgi:DNA polymerase-3 subunit delta'